MPHQHPVLFRLSRMLHGLISRSRTVSKGYLETVGYLIRSGIRFAFRETIMINIRAFPWPQIQFRPRNVRVTNDIEIKLVPHCGEFDFNALFSNTLGYEPELFKLLSSRLARYDAILEIGANVGVFTVFLARQCLEQKLDTEIFSWEPSPLAYKRLIENLAANEIRSVQVFNAAVSDISGFLALYEPEGHLTNGSLDPGFASLFSSNIRKTVVPSVSSREISALVCNRDRILLKIDVEGAEALVLKGLEPLIREKQPDLILEVLEPYEQDLNALKFLSTMYNYYIIRGDSLTGMDSFVADPMFRDYLLVPRTN